MNRKDILKKSKIDTSQYFALALERDDYPEDAVVTVSVKKGDEVLVETSEPMKQQIAKTSKFFNKIMADGYIFNPYLHRRWIAKQFLAMMKKDLNVDKQIKENYDLMYSIRYTRKEFKKIQYCMDYDTSAERRMFFSGEAIKQILLDYLEKVEKYLESKHDWFGLWDEVERDFVKKDALVTRIKYVKTLIDTNRYACITWENLEKLVDRMPVVQIEGDISKSFLDAFKKSGVYYTFKHLVLFEGCVYYKTNDSEEILDKFAEDAFFKPTYVLYGMLKDLIKINNYQL